MKQQWRHCFEYSAQTLTPSACIQHRTRPLARSSDQSPRWSNPGDAHQDTIPAAFDFRMLLHYCQVLTLVLARSHRDSNSLATAIAALRPARFQKLLAARAAQPLT